jgi:hypothetical protein
VGFIGLLAKLHAWDESAMFFDGSSIGKLTPIFFLNRCVLTRTHTVAYILALAVYVTVTIPSLRTIVTPVAGETRNDKIEAMRVLSAGNTIIVVILVGVLLLQVRLNRMDYSTSLIDILAGWRRICETRGGERTGENHRGGAKSGICRKERPINI